MRIVSKEMLETLRTEVLQPAGSDCKTKRTIKITLPKKGIHDFDYRYIIENGTIVCLTPDIIESYIGKSVQMRTPMFCTTPTCNICAGEFFYKQMEVLYEDHS